MFGGTALTLLDPRVWIAALLIALAGFGLGYLRGNTNGKAAVQAQWDKERAALQAAVTEAKDKDINQGQQASARYQEQKANEAERIRVVRETVVRTVTGPCLDANGLRLANQAIGGVPPASASR